MAEDLTGYTEVDPVGYISKTSSRVTLAYLLCSVDAYLYHDFGVNYFDKIDLQFAGRVSSSTAYNGMCCVGFANNVNDYAGWSQYISVVFYRNNSTGKYGVTLVTSGMGGDSYEISANTTYYFTLSRSAGSNTVTLKIYSDSARTALLDTLSAGGVGTSTKFQYFYPAASFNTGDSSDAFYGYFENFVLNSIAITGGAQIIGLDVW